MRLSARCIAIALLIAPQLAAGGPATGRNAIPADAMERPPELAPAVSFWREIFGHYSRHQVVVHASDYPNKIFTVLDYRAEAARGMDPAALARKRRDETSATIDRINRLLGELDAAGGDPSGMGDDARAIADLFADVAEPGIFGRVQGNVRAQQGVAERTRGGLERAGRYLPYMESVFAEHDLPRALTRLPLVESSFDTAAYSKVGAAGVWQFIPSSARHYMRFDHLVDDRRDPWTATHGAARHLRDDFEALGNWPLAVTAYNFGRHGIRRALEQTGGNSLPDLIRDYDHPRFGFASRNFYASFLAALDVDRERERWFDDAPTPQAPARFDEVQTRHYVAWSTLQSLSGWNVETFASHNPAYSDMIRDGDLLVPPDHRIRVAPGHRESFAVQYLALGDDALHARQRDAFLTHRVGRGETLSGIARRYGTSASRLQHLNALASVHRLRAGQDLRIPAPGGIGGGAAVASSPGAPNGRHRVRSGETLSGIARRYGTSTAHLQRSNGIADARDLRAGQTLRVPATGGRATHVVASGETLSGIAQRYGSSSRMIAAANGLADADLLRPGMRLEVPTGGGPLRHRVAAGETLWDIARRHGTSLATLTAHNALEDADSIRPGLMLEIPAPTN